MRNYAGSVEVLIEGGPEGRRSAGRDRRHASLTLDNGDDAILEGMSYLRDRETRGLDAGRSIQPLRRSLKETMAKDGRRL